MAPGCLSERTMMVPLTLNLEECRVILAMIEKEIHWSDWGLTEGQWSHLRGLLAARIKMAEAQVELGLLGRS